MPRKTRTARPSSGLLLLVTTTAIGYLLVNVPPALLQKYEIIQRQSPTLAKLYLGTVLTLAVLALLWLARTGFVLWRRSRRKAVGERPATEMTPTQIRREIADRQVEAREVLSAAPEPHARELQQRIDRDAEKLRHEALEIVAFGTVSSGKSSLLNALVGRDVFATDPRGGTTIARNEVAWPGHGRVRLVDTPGLEDIQAPELCSLTLQAARDGDLLIFVADGPLRSFEHEQVRSLKATGKRLLVCLNKEDSYRPADRDLLLGQMRQQVQGLVLPEDLLAVRARPGSRVRVRVTPDGREVEESVAVEPDVSPLAERMLAVLHEEGHSLLLANLLQRSRGLVKETQARVRDHLDGEARAIIQRTMWEAGGVAALSPFPVLDVAAGLGISYKMVMDLAALYRQQMDLDSARELVAQAGKQLLATAGATVATPAIATVAASALKTVPGVGTLAGGLLQGLVQALVTRWVGHVFMAYFGDELGREQLPALARTEWSAVTRPAELAKLVQEGVKRLRK